MAANKSILSTTFPRLDTLSTDASDIRRQSVFQRREHSYASTIQSQPCGKSGILRGYCRLVAALTGNEDVCFRFITRNDYATAPLGSEIVVAEVTKYSVEICYRPHDGEQLDFGLELLADLDNFDHTDSLCLDCVSTTQQSLT